MHGMAELGVEKAAEGRVTFKDDEREGEDERKVGMGLEPGVYVK